MALNPKYITIHCSATQPVNTIDVETIRQWHLRRGWRDIGYHFVITVDGVIQPGRPLDQTGSHVFGHNKNNIGICLIGGVDSKGKTVNNYTDLQWDALRYLITELAGNYGILEKNILGHREWYGPDPKDWKKLCPCFNVADKLEEWK